ncbi:hypothetical protein [Aquabacter spiritensis]|uniref:Uncharacterized protein n=1 Tax=Aquabacter spiritensis TaxID=933073 RepID=A0A4R3LYX4_9HYPH|nr:hypothetical protein [Aquabacter spiritensis]TCT03927.1 hypothetical protein EDC64_10893 [Aquabacter spiritensis]
MVQRAVLLFVAVVFLCTGTAFLGVGLYHALLLSLAPWAAGLITGGIGLALAGLLAAIATRRRRVVAAAPLTGSAFGFATSSVSRAVENHPLAAIAAAAAVGLIQSMILGRRR